ncbi:protein 5NUC-like [Phymastichus coffea]|uniref:protein 5NUC-like n=1 Tax=Phymastichus coffea TaxID=108790 RepID=UPI00273C58FB|nr:protein 5NUC-like [Phymastichus coffea]
MKRLFWLWALVLVAAAGADEADGKLRLRILHTNDMHSRFEEVSKEVGYCSKLESAVGLCYGGFARLASLVRTARASANASGEAVLFLNAGDTYQGTKLYSHYKASIVIKFLNMLRPDVVSLGNHEFDDKIGGLLPYLNQANFPVLAANLDLSLEPDLRASKRLAKSHVLQVGGRLVGIVGYLTPETAQLSQPGRVRFLDEVAAVRAEARRLEERGCHIVIALGHSGYETDQRIAREVEQVDLVIGGHTNTFLYGNGRPDEGPDREVPEGPYPTVVTQSSGRKVYVVQAYAYTKYLGDLRLEFDARGEVSRVGGSPILVDAHVPKDPELEAELVRWQAPLASLDDRVVGTTHVLLDGDEKVCRLAECNLGNLLTDAIIYYNAQLNADFEDRPWTDSAVAINQAGGIRASINLMNDGKVTVNDIITSFPFTTKVYKVQLPGRTLKSVLEWSVHDRINRSVSLHGGSFLQMSGLQVTYDLAKPVGSRVISARVRCSLCMVPTYHDLDPNTNYTILMNDFLYNGGDGFQMFKGLKYQDMNVTIDDVVTRYINRTSPVYVGLEGRISFVEHATSSAVSHVQRLSLSLLILQFVAFARFF